jgi:HSP20 family molecular chaperone IbpA
MSSQVTAKQQDQPKGRKLAVPISTGESLAQLAREVQESVARRAYDFYEARGRHDGQDLEDWFRAERELTPLEERIDATKSEVQIQIPLENLPGTDLCIGVDWQHVIVTASRPRDAAPSEHRTIVSAKVIALPAEIDPSRATASSDGRTLTIDLPRVKENQNQDS